MMTEEQHQLLQLVAHSLFKKPTEIQINDKIKQQAINQTVLGLIDPKAYSIFINNVNNHYAHSLITELLQNVPCVTIKGYASAYYYPQPIRRTMGDVDFLVAKDSLKKADQILKANGFILDHQTNIHRCFRKDNIIYEMHSEVNGIPKKNNAEIVRMLEDTIATSRIIEENNYRIIIPDDFHNGLICLLHILNHMTDEGIGLRHFCDWACLVSSIDDFESIFKERFQLIGLWKCAKIFSLAAVKYIGLPYRKWMGDEDDYTLELLIEEIMNSGNFGSHKKLKQADWFTDVKAHSSKASAIMSTLNRVVKREWPIVRIFPFFYPIGWIYFPMRYIVWMIQKKRRYVRFTQVIEVANEKNKLYEKLDLFVKE